MLHVFQRATLKNWEEPGDEANINNNKVTDANISKLWVWLVT